MMAKYLKAFFWRMLTLIKRLFLIAFCFLGKLLMDKEQALDLKNVKKILVIHGEHSSIGDAVIFSAILHPLRKRFPAARIEVLMRHPAEEVIKYNRNLDEIIPYTAEEGTNLLTQEFAPRKIAGMLRKRKYDLVITSEHAFRFIWLSYMTGARNRIGYDSEGRGFLLTKKVPYPKYEDRDRLELEYYLDLVRALGIEATPSREMMKINYSSKEKAVADRFLKENGIRNGDFTVGLHPGGGIWKKRWPLFKFAKLAELMIKKQRAKIIVFGGNEDGALAGQMQKMMKGKMANAAGKLRILETAALLEHCKLVVANDSAISHMAATTGAKVLTLFGVDSPKRWAPFGGSYIMRHRRLDKCGILCNYDYLYAIDACFDEKEPYCMNRISVEEVFGKIARIAK